MLYAIMRAGYLNKVRTYRFIIILCLTIVAGYIFVPSLNAGYVTLGWSSSTIYYRGIYNSAWIGTMVAMLAGIFLTLLGFFVVNDSVKRDKQTRVGEIIASTPLKNSFYTLGNALCNFAVLSTMVAIVFLTSIGMQLVRGESFAIDLIEMGTPFLVFTLPLMLLVASIAVFFETRSVLRGGFGNIMYLFSWMIGIPLLSDSFDLFGIGAVLSSMRTAGITEYPEMAQSGFILGFSWESAQTRILSTFVWNGFHLTYEILQTRLLLIFLAVAIALFASVRFSRFDPAREAQEVSDVSLGDVFVKNEAIKSVVGPLKEVQLSPLNQKARKFSFKSLVLAEFRLTLREIEDFPFLGVYGFAVAGVLVVVGLFVPINTARGMILPLAWFLPVLIWSKMGTREVQYHTDQLIFSSANILRRQIAAIWIAGVLLALITGSGVALNLVIHGEWSGLIAWSAGAIFIPSLALCLGVWTGSSKVFEFLYTLLWYIGPLNQTEPLDFMGALPGSVEAGIWQFYLAISIVLVGLAFVGRKWQIHRE
ncbi:MAG: hypothetical protein ACFE7R_06160 [Candidatus Hodarchaeota archaeon]